MDYSKFGDFAEETCEDDVLDDYYLKDFAETFCIGTIKGRNETEIYKKYVSTLNQQAIVKYFDTIFNDNYLQRKNDAYAYTLLENGTNVYRDRRYVSSISYFSKSLRHATFNSTIYARAIAKRASAFSMIGEFKACIQDCDLGLISNYPLYLKTQLLLLKIDSYRKLGFYREMFITVQDLLNYVHFTVGLTNEEKVHARQLLVGIINKDIHIQKDEQKFDIIPKMAQENPDFAYASASVSLMYNRKLGRHVVATKPIERGEVIFLEEIYAFSPIYEEDRLVLSSNCHFCLKRLQSFVPCRECVKYVYCSEKCRSDSWEESHRWECFGVQIDLFSNLHGEGMALRLVLKGLHTGYPTLSTNPELDVNSYGNKEENYPYIYKLSGYSVDCYDEKMRKYAANAVFLVHYLSLKTDFFDYMKLQQPFCKKTKKELMNKIGALLIRHSLQFSHNIIYARSFIDDTCAKNRTALLAAPSVMMMNHACVCNTAYHLVGNKLVVKALRDIRVDEELNLSYLNMTNVEMSKWSREKVIMDLWHFKCECPACLNPKMNLEAYNGYLCLECNGTTIATQEKDIYLCLDCYYQFAETPKLVIKFRVAHDFIERFTKSRDVKELEKALNLFKSFLHPLHTTIGQIEVSIMDHYRNKSDLLAYLERSEIVYEYSCSLYGGLVLDNAVWAYKILLGFIQICTENRPTVYNQDIEQCLPQIKKLIKECITLFNIHYPNYVYFVLRMELLFDNIPYLRMLPWACRCCGKNCIYCFCKVD